MIEHWQTLSLRAVADCRVFSVDMVQKQRPSQQSVGEFACIRAGSWVNIIPLTDSGTVIMVRQYRHGVDEVTLEVPGGIVDDGESPLEAAMRECREETGYEGMGEAELIGVNYPNPAIQDNSCYSYLWRGCRPAFVQHLDEHEDIEVVEIPMDDVPGLIGQGAIRHSLVLTAFLFYTLRGSGQYQ